jgi:hypothetical protein
MTPEGGRPDISIGEHERIGELMIIDWNPDDHSSRKIEIQPDGTAVIWDPNIGLLGRASRGSGVVMIDGGDLDGIQQRLMVDREIFEQIISFVNGKDKGYEQSI